MAIQIINDPNRSVGASVGRSVGGGVGQALNYLAQKKLSQIEERQRRAEQKQLAENSGLSPKQAELYASYHNNPEIQYKIGQAFGQQNAQRNQQDQSTTFQAPPSIHEYQEPTPQYPAEWGQGLQRLQQGPEPAVQAQQDLMQRLGLQPSLPSQYGQQLAQAFQQGQFQPQRLAQKQEQPPLPPQALAPQQTGVPAQPQPIKKALSPFEMLGIQETPQQKTARLKMEQKEKERTENLTREERLREHKETQPYWDNIEALHDAGDLSKKTLGKMNVLIDKKNLPFSAFYNLFNKLEEIAPTSGAATGAGIGYATGGPAGAAVGGAIGGIISPIATLLKSGQKALRTDTEQFEKLSFDFIRGAKAIFGSRITDADLQAFLKMIPTLAQTDKGKKDIINNMQNFIDANEIKYQIGRQIIKENGGLRPGNLRELIEERAKPQLDKLAQQFLIV